MVVKANDRVIDLGTGSGILAILAAKQGARVTAVDVNQDSLTYAREAARQNGVADRIEFVHSHFADFTIGRRADVVICEMLSSMMLIEQQVSASSYAVENLLKPSGHIIPEEVSIFVVPVQDEIQWNRFQIDDLSFPRVPQTVERGESEDLADLLELAHFDLRVPNPDAKVDRSLDFRIVQTGTVHGLVGMFECRLHGEITLTMDDGWRELFLPLPRPVDMRAGQTLSARVAFRPGEYDSLLLQMR